MDQNQNLIGEQDQDSFKMPSDIEKYSNPFDKASVPNAKGPQNEDEESESEVMERKESL